MVRISITRNFACDLQVVRGTFVRIPRSSLVLILAVNLATSCGAVLGTAIAPPASADELMVDTFSDSNGNMLSGNKPKLEGGVREDQIEQIEQKNPSLRREDIVPKKKDPFSQDSQGKQEEIFIPSPADFELEMGPQAPTPKFEIDINRDGSGGQFQGVPGQAVPGLAPQQVPNNQELFPNQNMLPVPPKQISNDPESVGQMKLLWDAWHKRLAENVYFRFDYAAKMFRRPLYAEVTYDVTADGRVINVRMLRPSPDMIFNATLLGVIKTLNGNSFLAFPQGSRRQIVAKRGIFTRNFGGQGPGYNPQRNDFEQQTVPVPRPDPFRQGG